MQKNNARQVNFDRVGAKMKTLKELKKNQDFLEGIEADVSQKSYQEENKVVNDTAFYFSYLFNLLSVLSAGYAVFDIANMLFQNKWIAGAVGIIVLVAIEQIKRLSSSKYWKSLEFHGRFDGSWLFITVAIFILSAALSAYGTKEGTTDLAGTPELIESNRLRDNYLAEIADKKTQIAHYQSQKDQKSGLTFYKLIPTIEKLETEKADYEQKVKAIDKVLEGKNTADLDRHSKKVELSGWVLLSFLLVCEILFEICVRYNYVYRKKVYIEMKVSKYINVQLEKGIRVTQDMIDIYVFKLLGEMIYADMELKFNQRPSEYDENFR